MTKIERTCIWFATQTYHLKTKNCWYRKSCHRRKVEREETFSVKSGLDVRNNGSDQFQISIDKFLNGQKLAWIFRLHGIRGSVQVFERKTVPQSVTEFAQFGVNGLRR